MNRLKLVFSESVVLCVCRRRTGGSETIWNLDARQYSLSWNAWMLRSDVMNRRRLRRKPLKNFGHSRVPQLYLLNHIFLSATLWKSETPFSFFSLNSSVLQREKNENGVSDFQGVANRMIWLSRYRVLQKVFELTLVVETLWMLELDKWCHKHMFRFLVTHSPSIRLVIHHKGMGLVRLGMGWCEGLFFLHFLIYVVSIASRIARDLLVTGLV